MIRYEEARSVLIGYGNRREFRGIKNVLLLYVINVVFV